MTVADRAAPRLAGIFGVKFPVHDLAASRAWYEKIFGLTLEFEFPDDDGVVRGVAYSAPGLGEGVANQVVEATIGWMVLFHDPDGLEIHLHSLDRGDLENSGRAGYGRPAED